MNSSSGTSTEKERSWFAHPVERVSDWLSTRLHEHDLVEQLRALPDDAKKTLVDIDVHGIFALEVESARPQIRQLLLAGVLVSRIPVEDPEWIEHQLHVAPEFSEVLFRWVAEDPYAWRLFGDALNQPMPDGADVHGLSSAALAALDR